MATAATPSIACLGVIGRNNTPLHMSVFASHDPATDALAPLRSPLQFSLLLSSSVDVFDLRARHGAATADAGLLHAVDDRLAAYGFETNTGVRFVCVVDMRGRAPAAHAAAGPAHASLSPSALAPPRPAAVGLRDADLKPVFRAMQTAYVRLLQNPFYEPDHHAPLAGRGGRAISSKRFIAEMRRIGELWTPGLASL